MITSASSKTALVENVRVTADALIVDFDDGRSISLPLVWYPSLLTASPAERKVWRPSGGGSGIHWPALDYDLSVEGILEGRKEHPNALRFTRAFRTQNRTTREAIRRSRPTRKLASV